MVVRRWEQGFTLPELLVTGAVFGVLITIAVFLVHPINYEPKRRDAQRLTDVAQLTQALNRYVAAKGMLPAGITKEAQAIGSEEGMIDLCKVLVPTYAKDLPFDPAFKLRQSSTFCDEPGSVYSAGYAISKTDHTITIFAPLSETGSVSLK